ncbi:EF-P 5-aminopentanol modification-associated protein YfmF [Bacillus sp. FJAT-42315]|uniref:EF-P 5-aminopentanol modification-associated protein YfmF n=1 Tax=Bacillus sp. FJAT-42315 TaxID=2014077 RepID=UPI000C239DA4|nr:pitrilysin family protein [Bacillus sp. FJAT-42315]
MTLVNEIVKAKKGYNLHIIKTDKYKTNTIVWKMKAPLEQETVTMRALLPYVLQNGSARFPTSTALRSHLDDLYGASFFVDLAKKGDYHTMSFSLEIANENYLKKEDSLLEKAFQFFNDVLTNPLVKNEAFDQEIVESEKRNLKQRIQSVYDDKMRYASMRLLEEMYEEDRYALQPNGQLDAVDPIGAADLYTYYKKAFSEDEIDLYIVGDVNEQQVEEIVDRLFTMNDRQPMIVNSNDVPIRQGAPKHVKEEQEINQGKLHIGYQTKIKFGDPDYFALQVFNGIFGGFSHSKLFTNVREKASLAYYAASRVESHKGFLMVLSGIDSKNYDQAVQIINEQLQAMKQGDISENEILQTRAVIRNQLLETIDTARGSIEILYHNVVAKQNVTIDDWLEAVERITIEEVTAVAAKIELDTIYFLSGEGVS